MPFSIKSFSNILLLIISIVILDSCVGTSKYEYALFQRDSLAKVNDSLQSLLKIKDNKVSNFQTQIDDQYKQIEDYKQTISKQQSELVNLKKNYDKLKQSSTTEIQEYLTKIEALQKSITEKESKLTEFNNKLHTRDSVMNDLQTKIKTALLGFSNSGLSVTIKEGKVYVSLSNQLLFESGSTQIDKNGKEALKSLAEVLNNSQDINILVEGHTDNQTVLPEHRFKDNWELSVLRATEVVKFLNNECGVDPSRVTASGRGEFFPVDSDDSKEARAKNRRTEIILTPKLDQLYNWFGASKE